ncbi:MAG: hypothetical protein HPY76_13870 [Anaerolineae bacterium]|nr:hypothetical protein [Anaerolineae bacterium]
MAQRQGVRLAGEIDPDVDPVVMDATRVGRVLANLVSNALRHTPGGGVVTISARRNTAGVEVTVRDSGEGIPTEDLPHIFDQFYRGEKSRSRQTGGAGLGLAIARGIVQAHGGTIRAESAPGAGTRVIFTLPSVESGCEQAMI